MREWFYSLSARERLMVSGCTVFVMLALLWALAVQPLIKHSAGLEERVAGKRSQLVRLQEQAALVNSADDTGNSSEPVAGANQSLVVIIDRTTRERQLAGYIKRNQPDGAVSVRLRLEGAPFDDLVTWLGDLDSRYNLTTTNANFDRAGTGRVNVTLTLSRSGF